MFPEITDNWPILACIALFFVVCGISALIKRRVRWECFRAQVCAYVRAWAIICPDADPDNAVYTAGIILTKHENKLRMPDKSIVRGMWDYQRFATQCLKEYAEVYENKYLSRILRYNPIVVRKILAREIDLDDLETSIP